MLATLYVSGRRQGKVVGVSRNYLRSKRFLQGEGELASLRWASPRAFAAIKDLLPNPDNIQVGE